MRQVTSTTQRDKVLKTMRQKSCWFTNTIPIRTNSEASETLALVGTHGIDASAIVADVR